MNDSDYSWWKFLTVAHLIIILPSHVQSSSISSHDLVTLGCTARVGKSSRNECHVDLTALHLDLLNIRPSLLHHKHGTLATKLILCQREFGDRSFAAKSLERSGFISQCAGAAASERPDVSKCSMMFNVRASSRNHCHPWGTSSTKSLFLQSSHRRNQMYHQVWTCLTGSIRSLEAFISVLQPVLSI